MKTRIGIPDTAIMPLIVRLLAPKRKIDSAAMDSLREALTKEKTTLEELMIRRNLATEQEISATYSDYYMIPQFEPAGQRQPAVAVVVADRPSGRVAAAKR